MREQSGGCVGGEAGREAGAVSLYPEGNDRGKVCDTQSGQLLIGFNNVNILLLLYCTFFAARKLDGSGR